MSDSLEGLRRQLGAAGDLKSVVRAMKALAASSIGQYERSVLSLRDYDHTIEMGLRACLASTHWPAKWKSSSAPRGLGIVIFGSDQGLVGQFNETLAEYMANQVGLEQPATVWAIGERMADAVHEQGFARVQAFELPNSVEGIAPLVGRLLVAIEAFQEKLSLLELQVFHHAPQLRAAYEPASQRLLPLDADWSKHLVTLPWPTRQIPQVIGPGPDAFEALLREYIFVSLFRACCESLASENASRLAGMQRAEKNIDELSGDLTRRFHRLRQSSIDEELFDVVAGFEALNHRRPKARY